MPSCQKSTGDQLKRRLAPTDASEGLKLVSYRGEDRVLRVRVVLASREGYCEPSANQTTEVHHR